MISRELQVHLDPFIHSRLSNTRNARAAFQNSYGKGCGREQDLLSGQARIARGYVKGLERRMLRIHCVCIDSLYYEGGARLLLQVSTAAEAAALPVIS